MHSAEAIKLNARLRTEEPEAWQRRNIFFSRFEEGVLADPQGLLAVTPEEEALKIADRLPGDIVLDAFCGLGGNSIAFARAGKYVVAADKDVERLRRAAHNATVYGVAHRIRFVNDDSLELLRTCVFDAVYLDPPHRDRNDTDAFVLRDFRPDGNSLLRSCFERTGSVAFSAPSTFDMNCLRSFKKDYEVKWSNPSLPWSFLTVFFGSR